MVGLDRRGFREGEEVAFGFGLVGVRRDAIVFVLRVHLAGTTTLMNKKLTLHPTELFLLCIIKRKYIGGQHSNTKGTKSIKKEKLQRR